MLSMCVGVGEHGPLMSGFGLGLSGFARQNGSNNKLYFIRVSTRLLIWRAFQTVAKPSGNIRSNTVSNHFNLIGQRCFIT